MNNLHNCMVVMDPTQCAWTTVGLAAQVVVVVIEEMCYCVRNRPGLREGAQAAGQRHG